MSPLREIARRHDGRVEISPARRWSMLAASTLAQTAAAVTTTAPAFMIPSLVDDGLSLSQAGLIAGAPQLGVTLTLFGWGWLVDRIGERIVLVTGLALTTLFSISAALISGYLALGLGLTLAGLAAASTNAASGRVVVGWFAPQRRGLAMGIRQMAQPVGVGIAAISIAVIAEAHGPRASMWVPVIVCTLALVVVMAVLIDPPRPARAAGSDVNPYRGQRYLQRIHLVSVLLVVPQFVVWTFALAWLIQDLGWSAGAAGLLVAVAQIFGALGRIGAGQLSDVVGSRMRPLSWVAAAAATTMALLGLTAEAGWWLAVPLVVVATVVTVADNGLAFTAVAERAGPFWSGRALGLQNTAQYLTATVVPPLGGWLVASTGYGWAFGLAALFPLLAIALVPVGGEQALS
ncbi:MAG: MFS transporter [Nocardioides sp.]